MSNAGKPCRVAIDARRKHQKIDGFGLNINSQHWRPELAPTMDFLREDLGATLYRVDIWGKSNWIDPDGKLGREKALSPENLKAVYTGEIFQKGWGMMRYLNQHGIEPYLTASGDAPAWMLGGPHKPEFLRGAPNVSDEWVDHFAKERRALADFDSFCEMLVSMIDWARNVEGLKFKLFGPLNESDIAQPEGPGVNPVEFRQVCELLVDKLDRKGLGDVKLVVAEQAMFGPWYLRELIQSRKLQGRIGVFSLHTYGEITPAAYQETTDLVKGTPFAGTPFWMTEYGDLEQSGEQEWYVGWASTSRLFDFLEAGFSAGLIWDAYDNYHDHNEFWTIYGVLRTGLGQYTPKKRYFTAKQAFRFVPPGFERIEAASDSPDLRVLAFASPDRSQVTLVGMNTSGRSYFVKPVLNGFAPQVTPGNLAYYRTSSGENCVGLGRECGGEKDTYTLGSLVPPDCIFTLTTVR